MNTLRTTVCFTVIALLAGCGEDTSRWEASQQATEGNSTAVSEAALPGATFNYEHTGIQTVARQCISRAAAEV